MMQQSNVNCRGGEEFKNLTKKKTDLHQEWEKFSSASVKSFKCV